MLKRLWLLCLCFFFGPLGIHRFWFGLKSSGIVFIFITIFCVYFSKQNTLLVLVPLVLTIIDFFYILFTGKPVAASMEQKMSFRKPSSDFNEVVQKPGPSDNDFKKGDKKMRKSYSDDFKRQVAEAAQREGTTLKAVGEKFNVSPTLVRNWKIKYQGDLLDASADTSKASSIENPIVDRTVVEIVNECCEALENKLMQRGLFTQVVTDGGGVLNSVSILLESEDGGEYESLDDDFVFVIKLYCEGDPGIEEEEIFDIIEPIIDENPAIFLEFGLNPDRICNFRLIIEEDDW